MIISVLNNKGGVGKTAVTINLGFALAMKGYSVLLVDLDGQCNLTERLKIKSSNKIIDLLQGSAEISQSTVERYAYQNNHIIHDDSLVMDVVSGCHSVDSVLIKRGDIMGKFDFLRGKYDYILMDCPPKAVTFNTDSNVNNLVLHLSDHLIIPVNADASSVAGIGKVLNSVAKINSNIGLHILFNKCETNTVIFKKSYSAVKRILNGKVLDSFIRKNIDLSVSEMNGTTIFEYKSCLASRDFKKLADEIELKLK